MAKDEQKEERPGTLNAVIDDLEKLNFENSVASVALYDETDAAFPHFIDVELDKICGQNEDLFNELKAELGRLGMEEEQAQDLCHRIDAAMSNILCASVARPYLKVGAAIGMKMCGLSAGEIKARLAWLG